MNVKAAGCEVDFLWPKEKVVVEVDGRAYHDSPRRFESDRRRNNALIAAGLHVVRVTWHQITNEPEALLKDLVTALIRHSPG